MAPRQFKVPFSDLNHSYSIIPCRDLKEEKEVKPTMKMVDKIKIRGYHVDNFRHVNHARYVEFFEEGRWAYTELNRHVEDLFMNLHKKGIIHVVVNININYRKGAQVGDILRIETDLSKADHKCYTMSQKAFLGDSDTVAVDAEVINVFFDRKFETVVEISDEIIDGWPELGHLLSKKD
jgi:thioesterase-3